MTTKKLFLILYILLIVSLLASACGSAPATQVTIQPTAVVESKPSVEPTPAEAVPTTELEHPAKPSAFEGFTLKIGITDTSMWGGINPLTEFSWGMRGLLSERLVRIKTLTSVEPGLAESWEHNEDFTVWTFKIRKGMTFHDGSPCTAEEIAWSYNFEMENKFPATDTYVGNFKEVKALDPTTLQITTKTPDRAVTTGKLIGAWIVPPSVWKGMNYDQATGYTDLKALIGAGPYKATDYVEGEYLVLDAFENYWEGKPAIDRVIFQIYGTEDALVEAISNGEVDVIDPVPGQAVERLKGTDNVEVVTLPMLATYYLMINSYKDGTQPKSLFDPIVRKAMEYATDRQQIIDVGFYGYAEPATIPAAPGFGDLHNPNIKALPFDPAEGNRILDEANYKDNDGDGIREWSDGTPLEYRMFTDLGANGVRMLEIVAKGFADVGISVMPQEIDDTSNLYPDYDFDLATWTWFWDPDIDESLRSYTCAQAPDGWNDCGWCDPEYDKLYDQQKDPKLTDEARRDIIWKMQEMFYEGRGYISWFYPKALQAYRTDRVSGFEIGALDSLYDEVALLKARPVP